MSFPSGQRRRRVLTDQLASATANAEPGAAAPTPAAATPPAKLGPAYESDTITRIARVTDLTPHRWRMLAPAALGLLAFAAGLVALHIYSPGWSKWLSPRSLETLNLTSPTGLASWFGSLLLTLAAGLSLLIFAVRRHRKDDYQGRYRAWFSAAALWMLLSLASTCGLADLVQELGTRTTQWQGWRAGTLWWLAPTGLCCAVSFLRLGLDMRRCVAALLAFGLTAAAWSAALAVEFGWLTATFAPAPLLRASLLLLGNVLLVVSLLVYARQVVLQAAGILAAPAIPRRKKETKPAKKKRPAKKAESGTSTSRAKAADSKPKTTAGATAEKTSSSSDPKAKPPISLANRPGAATLSLGRTDDEDDDEDDEDDSLDGRQRLSKADRKRLRRERSRESRAA